MNTRNACGMEIGRSIVALNWIRILPKRQAWCNLQVKLCDPCLSALCVLAWRYINSVHSFSLCCPPWQTASLYVVIAVCRWVSKDGFTFTFTLRHLCIVFVFVRWCAWSAVILSSRPYRSKTSTSERYTHVWQLDTLQTKTDGSFHNRAVCKCVNSTDNKTHCPGVLWNLKPSFMVA